MVKKKAKKYEGGGIIHDTIPGQYNSMTGKINPRAAEDVEAIPVAEPRRIEPQDEFDAIGEKIREIQAAREVARNAPAPRAAAPRATARPSTPATRQEVADAVAQAVEGREPQPPEPRRRGPYTYGGPSPLDPLMRMTGTSRRNREAASRAGRAMEGSPFKKGGSVKSSASKRADGCAQRGKTKGRMV